MRVALREAQTADPCTRPARIPSEHARSGLFEGASGSEPAGKGRAAAAHAPSVTQRLSGGRRGQRGGRAGGGGAGDGDKHPGRAAVPAGRPGREGAVNRKPLEAGQGAKRREGRVAGSSEHGGPGGWAGGDRAGRLWPGRLWPGLVTRLVPREWVGHEPFRKNHSQIYLHPAVRNNSALL